MESALPSDASDPQAQLIESSRNAVLAWRTNRKCIVVPCCDGRTKEATRPPCWDLRHEKREMAAACASVVARVRHTANELQTRTAPYLDRKATRLERRPKLRVRS